MITVGPNSSSCSHHVPDLPASFSVNFSTGAPILEGKSVFKRLKQDEEHQLLPGDAFRIGTLEFEVMRFNTCTIQDIGGRPY